MPSVSFSNDQFDGINMILKESPNVFVNEELIM